MLFLVRVQLVTSNDCVVCTQTAYALLSPSSENMPRKDLLGSRDLFNDFEILHVIL